MATNDAGVGSVFSGPQCLIYTASDGRLNLNINTLQQVAKLTDKKLVVVAIAGTYRTGKSYLLNRLAGSNAGFDLGSTIESKTKGIWIWIKDHPKHADQHLVLLDTEGLGDAAKGDNTHDCWLFCLATLLSSLLVYNAMGTITEDALAKLNFIGEMSKHIRTRAAKSDTETDEDFDLFFPHFLYVLRDFTLDLKIGEKEVSADEYLEAMLTLKKETDETTKSYNMPRKCIRQYFKHRKCFTFDRPAGRKQLKNLESLSDQDLSTEFIEESEMFCNHIYNDDNLKTLETGQAFTGRMWSSIAQTYVEAIRNGAVPCIENAVNAMAKIENAQAITKSVEVYQNVMSSVTLPTPDDDTFSSAHSKATNEAIHCFLGKAIYDNDHKFLNKLKENITEDYERRKIDNLQASSSKCKDLLSDLEKPLLGKVSGGGYSKAGGYDEYRKAVEDVKNTYILDTTLGVMAEKVLDEYLGNKQREGEGILAADKQITEEQRKAEEERQNAEAANRQRELADAETERIKKVADMREKQLEDEMEQLEERKEEEVDALKMHHEDILTRRLAEQNKRMKEGFAKSIEEQERKLEQQRKEMDRLCQAQQQIFEDYKRKQHEKMKMEKSERHRLHTKTMRQGQKVECPDIVNEWIRSCRSSSNIARGSVSEGDRVIYTESIHYNWDRNSWCLDKASMRITAVVAMDTRQDDHRGNATETNSTITLRGKIFRDLEYFVVIYGH